MNMKKYICWIFLSLSAVVLAWVVAIVWFQNENYSYQDFSNSQSDHIKENRWLANSDGFAWIDNNLYIKSNTETGLKQLTFDGQPKERQATTSPDRSKIIFSSLYNGYSPQASSTLTVIDSQTTK